MRILNKLGLVLLIGSGVVLSSACSGGSSSYSVYSGYGYPGYGNDWGYSSNYYYGGSGRVDQGQRLQQRDEIKQNAKSRPAGGSAGSRNMGRPSGGGARMGGRGRGGGRR